MVVMLLGTANVVDCDMVVVVVVVVAVLVALLDGMVCLDISAAC